MMQLIKTTIRSNVTHISLVRMNVITLLVVVLLGIVAGSDIGQQGMISAASSSQEIANKGMDEFKKTINDNVKKISTNKESIINSISSFLEKVVSDIVNFIKTLFGGDTPGQPALAYETAGMAVPSNRVIEKTGLLGILAVVAWCVYVVTVEREQKMESISGDIYRNFSLLEEENFL